MYEPLGLMPVMEDKSYFALSPSQTALQAGVHNTLFVYL